MLTAKGKYGLKALAHLAALKPGATTQAVEIAKARKLITDAFGLDAFCDQYGINRCHGEGWGGFEAAWGPRGGAG